MSKSREGKILYCDASDCEEQTLTRRGMSYPYTRTEKRGWIHFDRDKSPGFDGTLMADREKHFCSRVCFDRWLKREADTLERGNTMPSQRAFQDNVCGRCGKESNHLSAFRQIGVCISCHYSDNLFEKESSLQRDRQIGETHEEFAKRLQAAKESEEA